MSDETKPYVGPAPQRRVGSFLLLEKLGAGGIGEVWKARDDRLNRVVALKFIVENVARTGKHDLAREARAASALNHPNIVTILEIGETETGAYIAMEFVEGSTLRSKMAAAKLSFETTLEVITQVVRGLAAAHRHGIVHRDVKPENVMIRIDGYVKLVDFGLAKTLPWSDRAPNRSSTEDTETGQIIGTVSYMSPEQARGQHVDAASDVFSIGIVLYEMLTGEHPFRADNSLETLQRIVLAEHVSTRERCPQLAEGIHAIVDCCLKKDRTQRFASAADLETELRRLQTEPQPAPATRRRGVKPVVAAVMLSLVLLLLLWFWDRQPPPVQALSARSIAVMPFTSAPEDPVSSLLAQGLSEELGGALAREGFQVPPRSRVVAISAPMNAQSLGAQLQVDAVLEGNVINVNDSFRVHVELVDVKSGFQIWSRSSLTTYSDVLSSDSATAAEIARQLRQAARGR